MNDNSSGILGFLGLIGAVIVFFVIRSFFPSIANALLFFGGVAILLLVLLVAVVMYFALKRPKPGSAEEMADEERKILTAGRKNLMQLRCLAMEVKDSGVRTLSIEICGVIERILKVLKEQPENIKNVRQFFNYYLPTLGKILKKYIDLEANGIPSEELKASTLSCLTAIKRALEKQHRNLFEDDLLDLSVEMKALTMACKRDGLLSEEDFQIHDTETNIRMTL